MAKADFRKKVSRTMPRALAANENGLAADERGGSFFFPKKGARRELFPLEDFQCPDLFGGY